MFGVSWTFVFVLAATLFSLLFSKFIERRMVKRWFAKNNEYKEDKAGTYFRAFGGAREARVVAVNKNGEKFLIVLRLSNKYFRSFLDDAACESISRIDG